MSSARARLIKQCLKKDKQAWSVFIDRYSRLVYWAIRKKAATGKFNCQDSDVDDIFQEVFLAVFSGDKLAQLKDSTRIPGWLAMLAANKTFDYFRRKVSRMEDLVVDLGVFRKLNFKEEISNRDVVNITQEIINNLSAKERVVVFLSIMQERTHNEIAQITGLSINTVSTIMVRAKEKLRKQLDEKGVRDNF